MSLFSSGQVAHHVLLIINILFFVFQQIYPQDLQYLEVLGHGTGGTVYRYTRI